MTPKKSGIPYFVADGGQPYRIDKYILEGHTWSEAWQDNEHEFSYVQGHVLMAPDDDLMIFLYPRLRVEASGFYAEYIKLRDSLPRWTRTRWLGKECFEGSLKNGRLHVRLYDYRAERYVSRTCRGIKKLQRFLASRECRFMGVPEARRQVGASGDLRIV